LKTYFKQYKQYKCAINFKTDNIFWLGSSQRERLQYKILAQNFPLVSIDEQDKRELAQLAANNNELTYKIWYNRMK